MAILPQVQQPRVFFFPIKTTAEKLKKIVAVAEVYTQKKKPLIFFVPDKVSEDFLDHLLWEYKPTSFIPHVVTDTYCQSLIVITSKIENFNHAHAAFNLTPNALTHDLGVRVLYEFEDFTSKQKEEASKNRFENYRKLDFHLSYS